MKHLFLFCYLWCLVKGSIKVVNEENLSAAAGEDVTFHCQLITTKNVLQVTWQKESGNFTGSIATYSKTYGQKFIGHYSKRMVQFTQITSNVSAITLTSVNLEDQGCYKCIFNVFPVGASTGRVCLDVYETKILEPKLETYLLISPESSEKRHVISCSATGIPAPEITWNLTESMRGKPQQYSIIHLDQTVTVISNFTQVCSRVLQENKVTCMVRHPSLKSDISLSESINDSKGEDFSGPEHALLVLIPICVCGVCGLLMGFCFFYHRQKKHRSFRACSKYNNGFSTSKIPNLSDCVGSTTCIQTRV